ncbi:B3 domain-containing protein Os11g0197600-like [Impatiens glandulifera]|uniref:B3 domain-containing protein Os11g0197600-like n=1 Tax=Impatiens glandulifera TaxID=253017 RepID=UPI001FB0F7AD|nr:B3 domain-containing protein Os11g0197600-like [Impatiens glandulifera]XP_047328188.1 B3 domain-containing protein Os11g0197600-like [Impatiens glandulifera]
MFNLKKPHFIHSFDPTSQSERLKIPSKFVAKLGGKSNGTILLLGPSGKSWHVSLVQSDDNLYLQEGWTTFVQDNFIECGDSLVFRYDGDIYFTVQIFDQSSCEKEAAFSAVCSQDVSHLDELIGNKRERVNVGSFLDCSFESLPKKIRGSQGHYEFLNNSFEQCADESGNCCTASQNVVSLAMPIEAKFYHDGSGNKETEMASSAEGCLTTLSCSEAEGLAQSFSSSNPNFRKTMKMFNVGGSFTLNIPHQFSLAHLPKCKVKIVLRNLQGECWTVNSIPSTKVHMSHTFCGGWVAFVRDNNIKFGDICIFELVGKCELRVYILRVGKELQDCQSGKPALKGLTNERAATLQEKTNRKKCRKIQLQRLSMIDDNKMSSWDDKLNSRASKSSLLMSQKAGSGKLVRSKINLEDKQSSYTKGCMSMKSAPEEKLAAQCFSSSFPHFFRVMKKFNVCGSYTLKIPYQFSMEHIPDCKTEIVLSNLRGECWTVNSVPSIRVQTLHTFCGGWMAFVRENNIQLGDILIFELVDKHEMRVHISRLGKKGLYFQNGNGNAVSEETTRIIEF